MKIGFIALGMAALASASSVSAAIIRIDFRGANPGGSAVSGEFGYDTDATSFLSGQLEDGTTFSSFTLAIPYSFNLNGEIIQPSGAFVRLFRPVSNTDPNVISMTLFGPEGSRGGSSVILEGRSIGNTSSLDLPSSFLFISRGTFTRNFIGVSTSIPVTFLPEPMTWAMMVGGFGLIGGSMRRRAAKIGYVA